MHTPGPWIITEQFLGDESGMVDKPATVGSLDNLTTVAEVCGGIGWAEQNANARLIAAAPDLLTALKGLLDEFWANGDRFSATVIDAAREAIAKAEGGDANSPPVHH